MNNKRLTLALAFLLCAFILFQSAPAQAVLEDAVNKDGVQIVNLGQKTIINAGLIKAERTDDQGMVNKISFYNQSTIVEKQTSGKYYRTIAYEIALADANKNPLTEYKTYDYDKYRQVHMAFMQQYIKDNNLPFGKPYASEEILYREYLLRNFSAEQLDTAKYLIVNGIIEIYQINADGTDTVLYTINSTNKDKYYPEGFEALRSDILTRFVFVDLHPPAPDFWITSPTGVNFTGVPGSTITIPTEVWNSGEKKDTTDFISWWDGEWRDGESWDNKVGYYDNLTLGYSEKADTPVTVTVPEAPKTLWFRVNSDNNTPVGESDLTNNTLAVTVGPNAADVGVTISVDTTRPKRDCRVTATVRATNHGPATADVRLVIGENNGADQVVNHYDEDVFYFTLAPGASKTLTYKSPGYPAGHSTYFATKAEVTNTTDPNLANNFARSPQIIWQAPAPPPVVPSSDIESSLIH